MRRVLGCRTFALAGVWIAMACADAAPAGPSGESSAADGGPCAAPSAAEDLPTDLLDTGCMSKFQPTELAAEVIPYEVNSPLWSDGADKFRGMHLPKGGKIKVREAAADSGKWTFPVGTVLVKSFAFDGKLVETRLFAQYAAQSWVGYTYQWNEAQSVPSWFQTTGSRSRSTRASARSSGRFRTVWTA